MTSGFYKYSQLIKNNTNYAKRMVRLSNRIFGEVARQTDQASFKVVKYMSEEPLDQLDRFVNYYPKYKEITLLMKTLRDFGLFRDEHQDFRDEMNRLRAKRGKVRPKRGEGKRALKQKDESQK